MTVLRRPSSRRTIITSIERRQGDEPDLPHELNSSSGTLLCDRRNRRREAGAIFHIEYTRLHGGAFDYACARTYPLSDGVRRVLQPFVQAYVRGKRHDEFPVALGLV